MISMHHPGTAAALRDLSQFRHAFHQCLTARADALFELTDSALCADGPVTSLVELSLATEHRRGHGSLYDGLNQGRIDIGRFRNVIARQQIPRGHDGRIMLGIDVSHWLRPDANTSPDRLFCHTYARGKGQAQMIPGWPYSFVAALEPGRTSWTAMLDVLRVRPSDDHTDLAATQLRTVVDALITAGHWREGDPEIWIIGDSGYDGPRLAFLLADLPVHVLVRMRSDRVLAFPVPPRRPGTRGRSARHGTRFAFADPATWSTPTHTTTTDTARYGAAHARSWDRLHPTLTRTGAWTGHHGPLPIIEGTVIRLQVERLPGTGTPKPLWLWHSATATTAAQVDRLWQAFLRRFDLEHTFRFFKQTLGWTTPRIRTPEAADRWTWLVIVAYTQLRLARPLVEDLRRPWERKAVTPDRLSPARVRRGFRRVRPAAALPAGAPKFSRPGPGRPAGSRNARRAPLHAPGKTPKTDING
ncbi:NF041680 family putative transposase [Umezawaea sp. Da 62-37]|uniref:NF041680 family putative transposase n=1 Tax=Umezawaea sp. Da 62-37 TaxID=3075927 RepID=UPI0028F6F432|nr:NF041680 family putative transposase [Umezawaea sp. Da 62-37]WNV84744.1 NF041680 family putative transposase [Umezawaea sp. Da 62-37]WNV84808.1 NF041680 family putative transposase [Umezawaea sp. Da 62-37]WNV84973.1 NF041680 family putative transposase [Umezawaea sp. Da 62-37]WNV85168.1 NF041680 family putative transposase [Umezawaea sp. Da 62-37]WNV85236.1 NF041680 family putative transposase [Umezawaea sp. Da 62-37]